MNGKLSKLFHKQTNKDFKKPPLDKKYWPREWLEIQYKNYPRFKKVPLDLVDLPKEDLQKILYSRKSAREFDPRLEISFRNLSALLYYSSGRKDASDKRFYPSGGSRYPLEIYVVAKNIEKLEAGVYHYDVLNNCLELLAGGNHIKQFDESLRYEWSKKASLGIIISAVWNRNFVKYENFGYRLVLMEAGHLMQNLNLISTVLGLKSCSLGGFNNSQIDSLLDIENEDENSLYLTVVGN